MGSNAASSFDRRAHGSGSVVRRIKTVIAGVDLDCECRARLDEALTRFTALEQRRVQREHLVRARQHRERIEAIVDLLREVDELAAAEPDRSVYTELALLFDEVAATAGEGALCMRSLAILPADGAEFSPS